MEGTLQWATAVARNRAKESAFQYSTQNHNPPLPPFPRIQHTGLLLAEALYRLSRGSHLGYFDCAEEEDSTLVERGSVVVVVVVVVMAVCRRSFVVVSAGGGREYFPWPSARPVPCVRAKRAVAVTAPGLQPSPATSPPRPSSG